MFVIGVTVGSLDAQLIDAFLRDPYLLTQPDLAARLLIGDRLKIHDKMPLEKRGRIHTRHVGLSYLFSTCKKILHDHILLHVMREIARDEELNRNRLIVTGMADRPGPGALRRWRR